MFAHCYNMFEIYLVFLPFMEIKLAQPVTLHVGVLRKLS